MIITQPHLWSRTSTLPILLHGLDLRYRDYSTLCSSSEHNYQSGIWFLVETLGTSLLPCPQQLWDSLAILSKVHRGISRGEVNRNVNLTTHIKNKAGIKKELWFNYTLPCCAMLRTSHNFRLSTSQCLDYEDILHSGTYRCFGRTKEKVYWLHFPVRYAPYTIYKYIYIYIKSYKIQGVSRL